LSPESTPVVAGILGSLAAGLATGVGALPIASIGRPSERQENLLLGFAAGVMLAASFFSLIIPGLAEAQEQGWSRTGASLIVVAAVLLGAAAIAQLKHWAPPFERLGGGNLSAAAAPRFQRVWLFVTAITLHNFPEGLAVGVSFAGGDLQAGLATTLGIGLQNMPEGLAVAGLLASLGYDRRTAILGALATGLVEPIAGAFGAVVVSLSTALLPWALGFAAGAMIHIVVSEILPDTHERSDGAGASRGLMAGLALMMFLDTALG
jgi:ZIP family zinc transporter